MALPPAEPLSRAVAVVAFDFKLLLVPLGIGAAYTFWNSATASDPLVSLVFVGFPGAFLLFAESVILTWLAVKRWPGTRKSVYALTLGLGFFVSVLMFQWPLRLAFLTARPELDRIVTLRRQGVAVKLPARAGPFTIRSIEGEAGYMLAIRGPIGNREGFVWTPSDADYPGFNPWTYDRLTANWWRVTED